MGFLKSLLGINSSTHEKITLTDQDLGVFTALNNTANKIIWKGSADFLTGKIDLFLHGSKEALDPDQKDRMITLLENKVVVGSQVDKTLREQYENADKDYSSLEKHFSYISISAGSHEMNISLEERDSLYHFNVHLVNNEVMDVSIDS
ncbi:MAG: hypothetical protein EOO13_08020 [Chitinophagaceae bacterium]|nr:MAG: hypothetical protein EOO13_08020 [Chitinophagaceae bacterium]